ncbi:STAS-like domain-containing protein [Roseivivax sp. THAF197b]|uniref:STAS-like domain-containing protein n=1 Tax=Roseivivax sp. THAF197b TaxID=2588299 RepID=UPI001268FB5C|nr:STAS-like domain-containing protein [Roseivivax sp. THAF197b]QFS83966.1 hypothetical protein FIV09_14110 [Roseivivax sp. THAF197b]
MDVIRVVQDFHPRPAGRYPADGEGNGTTFRERFLLPALRNRTPVVVDLDGAPGYPSSFLEEAFGGLVREQVKPEVIREFLKFKYSQPGFKRYERRIWEHIDRASMVSN